MSRSAIALLTLSLAAPALAQEAVKEPRSGVGFAARSDGMSLLGTGLRTKTFLKVKVYAAGLYVADSALGGPLAAFAGKTSSPEFYRALVQGEFEKRIVMKFLRGVSTDQIRDAFRDSLEGAKKEPLDAFLGYFGDTKEGEEYVLTWKAGGTLETRVIGKDHPPIADPGFAAAVLEIWIGEKPVQKDIKEGLVSRASQLVR